MIKRLYISAAFWLLIIFTVKAQQNFVVNGGFEEYWNCPPVISQDSFPSKGWYSPNLGTPDYFHICSTDTSLTNDHIFFNSHSGNAHVGLGLISIEKAWMEHIQSQLTQPLKADKKYKVSFWVRLVYQYSDFVAYNIGLYFSPNKKILGDYLLSKDNYIEGMTPELQAQISNEQGKFITDTSWTEISGIYTAKGGEKYITIGMFWDSNPNVIKAWKRAKKNQSWSNTRRFGKTVKKYLVRKNLGMEVKYKNYPIKGAQHYPYYLLDDVRVVQLEE